MNVIKYLFSYIQTLTKQQQRHYNNAASNECMKNNHIAKIIHSVELIEKIIKS